MRILFFITMILLFTCTIKSQTKLKFKGSTVTVKKGSTNNGKYEQHTLKIVGENPLVIFDTHYSSLEIAFIDEDGVFCNMKWKYTGSSDKTLLIYENELGLLCLIGRNFLDIIATKGELNLVSADEIGNSVYYTEYIFSGLKSSE